MFTAIMKTEGGKVAKYQGGFATKEAADTHIATHAAQFPSAFSIPTPTEALKTWEFGTGNELTIVAPDMAELKVAAMAQIKARHAEMLVKLSGDYSSVERETWLLQLEWARGFIADQNTVHAVLLSGMFPTSPTSNMVDDAQLMADKIVEKSTAYAKLVMLSQRTKAQALVAIEAAQTPEDLATTMSAMAAIETAAIVELTQEEDTP